MQYPSRSVFDFVFSVFSNSYGGTSVITEHSSSSGIKRPLDAPEEYEESYEVHTETVTTEADMSDSHRNDSAKKARIGEDSNHNADSAPHSHE